MQKKTFNSVLLWRFHEYGIVHVMSDLDLIILEYDIRITCPYLSYTTFMLVRCSYVVSTGYFSTILFFLYNSELNKIVEATTTLRRPKTVRYRTMFVRRSHENGNLGIARSP